MLLVFTLENAPSSIRQTEDGMTISFRIHELEKLYSPITFNLESGEKCKFSIFLHPLIKYFPISTTFSESKMF